MVLKEMEFKERSTSRMRRILIIKISFKASAMYGDLGIKQIVNFQIK